MVARLLRVGMAGGLAAWIALLVAQGQQSGIAVGDGAPNSAVLALFLQAYGRGNFASKVALPPATKVHRDGSGYVQDFAAADASTGFNYALAKPDSLEMAFQMCCQILALHRSIGSFSGNIGYPLADPSILQSGVDGAVGLQQHFEGGHVIILHQSGSYAGQTFFIREPYVSRWRVTPALGFPIGQERNVTSRFGPTGVQQDFQGGLILQITSGARNGQVFVVSGPIYAKYAEIGGTASWIGFPAGDEAPVSGRQRQNFEGGWIEYVAGSGGPAEVRAPVNTVRINTAPLTLQVGNIITLAAEAFDSQGTPVTNRPVVWTTSNGSVIQIEAAGATARLRAVGPGFANIVAYVDGVASGTLRVTVVSACCQVGEGAPTLAIRQAFESALARNNITPRLPADNPVRRMGAGYGQEFAVLSPESLGRALVLKADAAGQAYVVAGQRLARYLELGGPSGILGFPVADANAAGRQPFENQSLLAGSPPVLAPPPVAQKWAALGFEAGRLGALQGEAATVGPSIFGAAGISQQFANGIVVAHTSGPRAGQAFYLSGPILARYSRLGGPAGLLGLPASDPETSGARTSQTFEGGSIEFLDGEAEARERLAARAPAVIVSPPAVPAGGRVRISVRGFAPGRRILVRAGTAPEFEVTPLNGAFAWDQIIRPGTGAGLQRVLARDPESQESAEGSYRVRAPAEVRYQLVKISGDNQSTLPGAEAASPLVVRLTDEAGVPVGGSRVAFATIGGAAVAPPEDLTDADGYARTRLRLPPAAGLALVTAEAAGRMVTFAARAEEGRLTTFPAFRQGIDDLQLGGGPFTIHQKGSLLTALAALLRYYQDRGELPAPNGLAEPAALNQFLRADGYLSVVLGGRAELVVNLLRALDFAGAAADFEPVAPDLDAIRDSLSLRRPVLIGLMLRSGELDRGAHYVIATGVAADGAILIHDPSPDWNRSALGEYLAGFSVLGRTWTARILHALRLRPGPRSQRGFLIHGTGASPLRLSAPGAIRGYFLRIPALAAFDEFTADSGEAAQLFYADGSAPQYQLVVGEGSTASILGPSPAGPLARGAYRIQSGPAGLAVTPQSLSVAADGLRNAAGFGPQLAPGSLASLFGSGLVETLAIPPRGAATALAGLSVTIGGRPAPLLFALPFQANLQIPYGLAPGEHEIAVTSPYGSARWVASLSEAAPGIFVLESGAGAVLNQDGTLNGASNPALRGTVLQVFVTGLGDVSPSVDTGAFAPNSPLSRAASPVTASLDGRPAPVLFAGLAPGFLGLGQVNVAVPASIAPNRSAQLVVQAGGRDSNAVTVAIE